MPSVAINSEAFNHTAYTSFMSGYENKPPVKATFLMPAHGGQPTFIEMPRQALRMAIITRESLIGLSEDWETVGVYILLGDAPDSITEDYYAYAGKATTGGLRSRLKNHLADKEKGWWERALLIADMSPHGFNSAEAGWLEGQLYDVLKNAPRAYVKNGNRPLDESLPSYDREELRRTIKTITSVMRTIGANPDTFDQAPIPARKARHHGVTVKDLIDEKLLRTGTTLYCTWSNRSELEESATVLEDGKINIEDNVFDSPSAAAAHLRGGATNGWSFWGIRSSDGSLTSLAELRAKISSEEVAIEDISE